MQSGCLLWCHNKTPAFRNIPEMSGIPKYQHIFNKWKIKLKHHNYSPFMAVAMPLRMSLIYWQPHLGVTSSNTAWEGNDWKYFHSCMGSYTEQAGVKGACSGRENWATEITFIIGTFAGTSCKEGKGWAGNEKWTTFPFPGLPEPVSSSRVPCSALPDWTCRTENSSLQRSKAFGTIFLQIG